MEHASNNEERESTDPSVIPQAPSIAETTTNTTITTDEPAGTPTVSASPDPVVDKTLIAESLSNGISISNGTVVPSLEQPRKNRTKEERPISGVVPPYWRHTHQRTVSRASLASVDTSRSSLKPAITLEDHTEDPNSATTRGLWAKSVAIDDHVVVSGKTGVGAYVVWMCNVQTLDGGPMIIRMRYSEFAELRDLLIKAFPHTKNSLPPLPPKSALFKFRPKFLEARRIGLQYFLNCVLLNPEFSGAPVLKDYLFERVN